MASSGQDFSKVLANIKAQQAAAESQMKHLVAVNRAKASALSRALDGDSFHTGLASATVSIAAHAAALPKIKLHPIKLHPRSRRPLAAKAPTAKGAGKGKVRGMAGKFGSSIVAGGGGSQADQKHVQARISKLLADSKTRLHQDEERTITDLTVKAARGPWFQEQQAARLTGDRRRVLGDQRLVKLLAAMEAEQGLNARMNAPMQHLDAIDTQARADLNAAEVHARMYGVADEINGNNKPLLAAGVHTGHSREFGMGGMEAEDEDHGSQVLQAAGIRTDALPGMGTKYAEAIPLPFFDPSENQQHNITALEDHHRPISPAGEHMLHRLKVNLASPNMFVYGDEAGSTPSTDRYRSEYGEYGFFDGLEDAETNGTIARQHKPLSFWFEHSRKGSHALAHKGKVNVYGDSTWDGIMSHMPEFVNDWSHPVKTDPSRPPEHWLADNHWVEKTPDAMSKTWKAVAGQ